ncbi:hypothetical protein M3Y97_00273100 [Aphelenchoides bicaudatus]|nr:hypothetical protein M3Y97_00273100 [Aphelenchoides bicaudatus]
MSSEKVSMSLDAIIKQDKKGSNKQGGKKGGVARKGKIAKKGGNKQRNNAGQKTGNAATKRLVQQLVNKALAQKTGGGRKSGVQTRIVRTANKFRGINRRSQVIKKGPRNTETVVIKKIVQQRPQPRQQQIVREVIVQEPARQRFVTQPVRRFNNNRQKVVYVEKRGPLSANLSAAASKDVHDSSNVVKTPILSTSLLTTCNASKHLL